MMCTTLLHGGVCYRTSTPHKIGNKMKEGKKKKKMKHTVSLMSYLKIKTPSYMCVRMFGSWLMRLLTTYTLSDQQGKIFRDYLL